MLGRLGNKYFKFNEWFEANFCETNCLKRSVKVAFKQPFANASPFVLDKWPTYPWGRIQ